MSSRREFITLLGGAAAWPLAARAQQGERMRRIGVLMHVEPENPEGRARFAAFAEELTKMGWTIGRDLRIDDRWGMGDRELYRKYAAELVAAAPDALFGSGSVATAALQRATKNVPIVFAIVPDPLGGGFVKSLARPSGNVTGFMQFEYSFSGKWLELLKEIAPRITRAAVLRNPEDPSDSAQFAVIQAVGSLLRIDVSAIDTRDADEVDSGIKQHGESANGGLIVTAGSAINHHERIITLAARYRLPAVYSVRFYAIRGGLISYGADLIDQYRRAAEYVDRILKGSKPAELPVQAPTKYELTINLKTARALGLDLPASVLARADEVIE